MSVVNFLFNFAFQFLNITVTVPLNLDRTEYLRFPLYLPFLIGAICEFLIILWKGIIVNRNNIE